METFWMKALQLITALALLVVIHELGHYVMARIFGIKVEKFYMFFNPWFSLAKWKPKSKPKIDKDGNEKPTWRDTEYGIGWVPLGGYCKIAGMIDESLDTDQMASEPKPWEFRTKPAYQRLAVMVGGVLFNFILAIVIYAGIAYHWGNRYIHTQDAYEGMDFSTEAQAAGFRNGDVLLAADGQPIDASESGFIYDVVTAKNVTVLRNHCDTLTIELPKDFVTELKENFMTYRLPVFVGKTMGGSPAAEAGLQSDDRIVAVGDVATPSFTEFTPALKDVAGKETELTLVRDGEELKVKVTPNEDGTLGFQVKPITDVYPTTMKQYSILQSVPKGWEIGTTTLGNYVGSLKYLFTSNGAKNIGGFGTIGNLFPERWNWLSFWEITAFLSLILAVMNLLPIPGLDGGHALFVLAEMITGRKPGEKFLLYAQYAGMIFIFALLIYANGADIIRAFF